MCYLRKLENKEQLMLIQKNGSVVNCARHQQKWKLIQFCPSKKCLKRPLEEVKAFLHEIDTKCEHGHYTKLQSNDEGEQEKELL